MIEIKNLSYQKQNKEILKNINLKISRHKMIGILGPNGSGKTTLLKHLAREISSKKTIFLDGIPMEEISRKNFAKRFAFVAQTVQLMEDILIEELVKMGRYPYKKPFLNYGAEDLNIVRTVLQKFQLEELKTKTIAQVSGGELKRAFLARAFAQQTEFILLDEPMNHLDIKHQLELMKYLTSMQNKTIICSLHNIELALESCDEIILMKNGEIVAFGETEKVLTEKNIEFVFDVKNEIEKVKGKTMIFYYE